MFAGRTPVSCLVWRSGTINGMSDLEASREALIPQILRAKTLPEAAERAWLF